MKKPTLKCDCLTIRYISAKNYQIKLPITGND